VAVVNIKKYIQAQSHRVLYSEYRWKTPDSHKSCRPEPSRRAWNPSWLSGCRPETHLAARCLDFSIHTQRQLPRNAVALHTPFLPSKLLTFSPVPTA